MIHPTSRITHDERSARLGSWAPLLFLLSVLPPAAAQQEDPASQIAGSGGLTEVERMRRSFFGSVLQESRTLGDQFSRALERLETELAAAGDYREAALVKRRQEELATVFQQATDEGEVDLAIPLDENDRRASGVEWSSDGTFTGWRSNSHFLEWTGKRIPAGTYHLEFEIRARRAPVAPASSANGAPVRMLFDFMELSGVTGLAAASGNRRSFEIDLATADGGFRKMREGPLEFSRPPHTLRLAAASSMPAYVFDFRSIRLVPDQAAVTTDHPAGPGVNLAKLRAEFEQNVTAARLQEEAAFREELEELADKNPALRKAVTSELQRLDRNSIGEQPPRRVLPPPLFPGGAVGDFTEWENVDYVPHEDNTGSLFHLRTSAGVVPVRLLWVECASPEDSGDSAYFCQFFDLPVEDAPLFGKAAREFVASQLEGRRFRVLARPRADDKGVVPVLIFLPGGGLLQSALIAQGLAALEQDPMVKGALERGLLARLRERVAEAAQHQPKRGAWTFKGTDPGMPQENSP
jgi:hypothetical protein